MRVYLIGGAEDATDPGYKPDARHASSRGMHLAALME